MLFNSFQFLIFLPVVVALYFILNHRGRMVMLLVASYYFYMCWRADYALLIVISTLIDYFAALKMGQYETRAQRRPYLMLSLVSNLGILVAFKYYNLFSFSLNELLQSRPFGIGFEFPAHHLLLPVGISFYTFQTLSYSIDVYRGECKPEKNLIIFALYVTFFPQLVAGPIERSTNLMPQFYKQNKFEYANVALGLKLILWGFFKKVLIADRLAVYVDAVYNNQAHHTGQTLFLATIFFSIQIYCDFSGYSDIAIGSARVMGYNLMENFRRPYFAQSIKDFWTRWHISLSTWFRDYLYLPLGGNRVARWRWYYNLFVVFLLSGFWHGANWTFLIWGAIHGTYLITAIVMGNLKNRLSAFFFGGQDSKAKAMARRLITYALVCFAWIFFRANSLSDGVLIIQKIALFEGPVYLGRPYYLLYALLGIVILYLVDWQLENNKSAFELVAYRRPLLRYLSYASLVVLILLIGVFDGGQFIYFQF